MSTLKRFPVRPAAALCALLLMICFAVSAFALSFPFDSLTTEEAFLRRSASANAAVLDLIPAGVQVRVTGESGNFFKVTYDGTTGYVLKSDISTAADVMVTPAPTENMTATGYPYMTTTNNSVNLREKASVNSGRIASIPSGATVTVEALSGSFAKVTYNGRTGFAKKEYINLKKIVKATATPKPTAVPTDIPTPAPGENASEYSVLQLLQRFPRHRPAGGPQGAGLPERRGGRRFRQRHGIRGAPVPEQEQLSGHRRRGRQSPGFPL